MTKSTLTQANITTLKLKPGETERLVRDDVQKGLILRIGRNNSKWVCEYRTAGGKQRRYAFGDVHNTSLAKARAEAEAIRVNVLRGIDPIAIAEAAKAEKQRKANTLTVRGLLDKHLATKVERGVRASTMRVVRYRTDKVLEPLHGLKLEDITAKKLAEFVADCTKRKVKVNALNRAIGELQQAWEIALDEALIDTIPRWPGAKPLPENYARRTRYLSDIELRAIWQDCENQQGTSLGNYSAAVRFAILTALRVGELSSIKWDAYDPETKTVSLSAAQTKTNEAWNVPLSDDAAAILEEMPRIGEYVFAGGDKTGLTRSQWAYGHRMMTERLKAAGHDFEAWRHHDFRRSCATRARAHCGVSDDIAELMLGHKVTGVKAHYIVAEQMRDPLRRAYQAYAHHIATVVGKAPSNVVPLHVAASA